MKKILSFSLVVLCFVAFAAMKADVQSEFKFEEETHDFGKIPQGTPVTYNFKFTNIGDQPLIISNIETSCGCTAPKYSNTPVKKGDPGTITITFNAAASGPFNKVITVKSNAKTPVKYLYIKGVVTSADSK